jgi:hypothetical protein
MLNQVPCSGQGCPNTIDRLEIPADLQYRTAFCSLKCASTSGFDMHWSGTRTESPTYIRKNNA